MIFSGGRGIKGWVGGLYMIRSVCMEFLCICAHTCVGAVFVVWEGWRGVWPCGLCCECAHTYMCALFLVCALAQMWARMCTRIFVCAHMCVRVFVRAQRCALCVYAHRGVRMFVRVCARVFSRV